MIRKFEALYTIQLTTASWDSGLPLALDHGYLKVNILVQDYRSRHRTLSDATFGTPPWEAAPDF